jgi:peptidyl-prolyl cis-trans isomerase SurA
MISPSHGNLQITAGNYNSFIKNHKVKNTMSKMKMLLFTGAMFFAAIAAQAQQNDDRVLMTIAGEEVTVNDFMHVFNKNNLNKEADNQEAIREYLDLYVNFRLKVKEAQEMGLDTTESFIKELEGYRKQLAQPYFKDETMTEKLLQEAYERKQQDIRASHILIRVDRNADPEDTLKAYNKIMEIREKFLEGEDFSALAKEYSEDPSARDSEANQYRPARKGNGGDLGYFSVFDMVYPFESGAYNTPVGSVSMPVRTDYGYHIILVTDKQPSMGQNRVAHIYVAIPPNSTPQDSLKYSMKIEQANQKLQQGNSFEKVVRDFSEDKGSVGSGGLLPWFTSNKMVPEFILAVRNLKDTGTYSKPFLTAYGWHIIKLIDRKPVGSFKEEEFDLNNRLNKDKRLGMSEEVVLERIKQEYGFKEDEKARREVEQLLDSTVLKGEWDPASAEGMKKMVMSLGNTSFTQQELATFIAQKQTKRIQDINLFFNEAYMNFVKEECLAYEDERLEEKYPEFRLLMQEYHDGILLFDLTDKKVWSKAVKDTTGLQEFYAAHQFDYMWGKRLSAAVITVLQPETVSVEEVRNLVASGLDIDSVLNIFNSDTVTAVLAEKGKYPEGDNKVIDSVKWKKGLSQNVDMPDGIAFAYVFEVLKPEPKTLEEARGIITADYQNFLEQEWIKELKAKYPVVINEEILATLK